MEDYTCLLSGKPNLSLARCLNETAQSFSRFLRPGEAHRLVNPSDRLSKARKDWYKVKIFLQGIYGVQKHRSIDNWNMVWEPRDTMSVERARPSSTTKS